MLYKEVNQLLKPGYLPFETGYERLSNGDMYIAVLTRMPHCEAKMIDWWFGYAGDTEKYKLWHPMHVVGDWDEHWRPGHYIGASHLVHEYIGGDLVKLRITFFEPSKIFDPSKFAEARVGAVICGDVGALEEDMQMGHLIHFVRDTDLGCEMRSRFWIFNGDEKIGAGLMQHCIEEMSQLGAILPGLYKKEKSAK
jgi:hypothetical protein